MELHHNKKSLHGEGNHQQTNKKPTEWEMFANQISNKSLLSRIHKEILALTGMAQWTKCLPMNQRVAGSIPSQGTCLGFGPGPQWRPYERQPHTDVSLPLFPSV